MENSVLIDWLILFCFMINDRETMIAHESVSTHFRCSPFLLSGYSYLLPHHSQEGGWKDWTEIPRGWSLTSHSKINSVKNYVMVLLLLLCRHILYLCFFLSCYVMVYCVYCVMLWNIVFCCGILCYAVVYCVMLWYIVYIVLCCGILYYAVIYCVYCIMLWYNVYIVLCWSINLHRKLKFTFLNASFAHQSCSHLTICLISNWFNMP